MLIDADGLSKDRRVCAVMGAPVAIADDGHRVGAGRVAVFGGKKQTAGFRQDAEHGKEISGYQFAPNAFGVILPPDAECRRPADSQAIKELEVIAKVNEVGIRT